MFRFVSNSFASDVIYRVKKPEITSNLLLKHLFYRFYIINLQNIKQFYDIFNNSKYFEIIFVT